MVINCGTLEKVKHFKGNVYDIYIAKLVYQNRKFNVTYNYKENNLIIHEWYKLTKDEVNNITNELTNYFYVAIHNDRRAMKEGDTIG